MSAKTISIIVLTALVTIILMKNMDEVNFWIFGNHSVSKLAVMGTLFILGVIVGWMLGKGRKKKEDPQTWEDVEDQDPPLEISNTLNDEDADYIR